ncbi:hypothetical protein [Microbacterium sp. LMI1x-1-1.1]|uniref:hypothetical protein n=1 Tax=Microbacterium sp. LMI1x-1-1.1 TaxID=3135246 RepID=UPI00343AA79A
MGGFTWMIGMAAMLVVILIAAMILAFVLAAGERRREQKDPTSLVRVTQIVAVVWAGVSAVGALVTLLFILLSPTVSITMPIQSFWPELPSQVRAEPTEATRVSGGFDSVTLDVAGLNPAARITWAISQVAAWLVPASIAALVAVACSHLLSGRGFAPVVARMASVAAVCVTAGGTLAQVFGDIAGSVASSQVFEVTGRSWKDIPGIEDPFAAWVPQANLLITFPFWPIAAGLGLAALAAFFRYGSRLQRDVTGLI